LANIEIPTTVASETTKHPSAEKCEQLGLLFLAIPEAYPEAKLDMQEFNWRCGTYACHGGWYEIICNPKIEKGKLDYLKGANRMGKFLGFRSGWDLMGWASDNPKIWGNQQGYDLFSTQSAFFAPGLKGIGKHWLQVADRLRKLEAK